MITKRWGFYFQTGCIAMIFGFSFKSTYAANLSAAVLASQTQLEQKHQKDISFLAKAKGIYISFNNGRWPDITYQYKVVFHDSEVTLTSKQLAYLNYTMTPINECMVEIEGPGYLGYALCETADNSHQWVESCANSEERGST